MKIMKALFAAFAVLVLFAGSAIAGSESYTVKKGDNLTRIARKLSVSVNEMFVTNSDKIKNINRIYPGQKLQIPDKRFWVWNKLMGNPFQGTIEEGLVQLRAYDPDMQGALLKKYLQGSFERVYIAKGTKVSATIFGRGIVKKDVVINWEGWVKKYTAQVEKDNVIRTCSMLYPDCGNPTPWHCEEQLKPPPVPAPPEPAQPPPVTEEKVKPKITFKIPQFSIAPKYLIAVHKPIACRDYELNARQGVWWGENAHGEFSYAEGGIWDTCWGWGRMIGFYANRDSGDSDSTTYDWNSWGVGPQAGLRYLDFYQREDGTVGFHGFTTKLRLIYAKISGKNPDVAYRMSQEEIMLGLYAEYVRQLSQKTTVAATFEMWISLYRNMETTFRGDTPSNRGQVQIGGYIQNQLSEDWAIRNGANLFHHMWDREQGIGVFSELRYQNFLLAGVAANFGLENGYNYGPYAGVEAGNKWREHEDRKIENGIWAIDENGNPLNPEDQIQRSSGSDCKDCVPAPTEKIETASPSSADLDKPAQAARVENQATTEEEQIEQRAWPNNQQ